MPSIFEIIPRFRRNRVKLTIPDINRLDAQGQPKAVLLLEMEATLSEVHTYDAEPTDNPVEDGSIINDHVNIMPRQIAMDCRITNHPLSLRSALIGNAAGLVGGVIGRASQNNIAQAVATGGLATLAAKIANTVTNDSARVTNALQKLQAAWEGAALVSIEGALTTYNNMLIKNITFNRNQSTAEMLSFSITLREMRLVRSRVVRVPKEVVIEAIRNSTVTETDNGRQPTAEPTAEQDASWGERIRSGESITRVILGL